MKKTVRVAAVVLTLLVMCLSLVGCSGGGSPLVGKWLIYGSSAGESWMEFRKDGTVRMETMYSSGKGEVVFEGTYTVSDNTLTLYKNGSSESEGYTWSIANDSLSLTRDGHTLNLSRYGTSSTGGVNDIVDDANKKSAKI